MKKIEILNYLVEEEQIKKFEEVEEKKKREISKILTNALRKKEHK